MNCQEFAVCARQFSRGNLFCLRLRSLYRFGEFSTTSSRRGALSGYSRGNLVLDIFGSREVAWDFTILVRMILFLCFKSFF
jgi:hypothetical protein